MGSSKSPAPALERLDSKELHERILSLSASEARKLGLGKNTFHYLRKNTGNSKPFKIRRRVASRLLNPIDSNHGHTMIGPLK